MDKTSAEILLTHFDWTIQRLDEIQNRENTPYYRSAALQRFGLSYEMALKCLDSIRQIQSEKQWSLDQDPEWQELVGDYHQIKQQLQAKTSENSSTTADGLGLMIYNKLKRYSLTFQKLYKSLDAKLKTQSQ